MAISKEYKAFKNYFSNTLGLNRKEAKEAIDSLAKEILEKQVNKKIEDLFDSKRVENYIRKLLVKSITELKEKGFDKGSFYNFHEDMSFESYVKSIVREEILKEISGKVKIEILP